MAEVAAPMILKCRACPRHYNSLADLCQVPSCGLCRGCHRTAYGEPQPHAHNDEDMLTEDARAQLAEARKKR